MKNPNSVQDTNVTNHQENPESVRDTNVTIHQEKS